MNVVSERVETRSCVYVREATVPCGMEISFSSRDVQNAAVPTLIITTNVGIIMARANVSNDGEQRSVMATKVPGERTVRTTEVMEKCEDRRSGQKEDGP